jgi:aspartate aminotransferase
VILSDDIYNRLVFSDEKVAPHLLHVAPDLQPRTVAVNGASKSFSMTGWRIGWAACPPALAKVLGDFFSQSTSNVCSITQKATLKALENTEGEVKKVREILRPRLDSFQKSLAGIKGLTPMKPDGAFYIWLDCTGWMGKTHKDSGKKITNSAALADLLLDLEAVATVPGIEFGLEGYLRLSFATSEAQLQKAVERFTRFGSQLS